MVCPENSNGDYINVRWMWHKKKNFHVTPMLIGMQNWSKIRSKSDICHFFLLLFISISTITGCLIWYEKHESIYEIIELLDSNGIPRCKFTSLRYDSRCRLLSYLVYQDVNPSTQKHMIEGIGYYHMITTRNIIVTYDSIVGYLLKAYDVVGIGYYHLYICTCYPYPTYDSNMIV